MTITFVIHNDRLQPRGLASLQSSVVLSDGANAVSGGSTETKVIEKMSCISGSDVCLWTECSEYLNSSKRGVDRVKITIISPRRFVKSSLVAGRMNAASNTVAPPVIQTTGHS